MATTRAYLIPGWGYVNEVKGKAYLLPGGGYINATVSTPAGGRLFGRSSLDGLSISGGKQFTRVD